MPSKSRFTRLPVSIRLLWLRYPLCLPANYNFQSATAWDPGKYHAMHIAYVLNTIKSQKHASKQTHRPPHILLQNEAPSKGSTGITMSLFTNTMAIVIGNVSSWYSDRWRVAYWTESRVTIWVRVDSRCESYLMDVYDLFLLSDTRPGEPTGKPK